MAGTPPGPQGTSTNQPTIDSGTLWPNASPSRQQTGKDGGVPTPQQAGKDGGIPTPQQTVKDGGVPTYQQTVKAGGVPTNPQTAKDGGVPVKLKISCTIVGGGALSEKTIVAVNAASNKKIMNSHLCIAYEAEVKVGGSLAWRANNPGNLRDSASKIGSVSGAVGKFAVFASSEGGRSAQRDLYLAKYGDMTVTDAVKKLTPPSENDTTKYLADLKAAGVDLDKTVKSQIDTLMKAIQVNEGLIEGETVARVQ